MKFNKIVLAVAIATIATSSFAAGATKYNRFAGFKAIGSGSTAGVQALYWNAGTNTNQITYDSATGACINCGAALPSSTGATQSGSTSQPAAAYLASQHGGNFNAMVGQTAAFTPITLTIDKTTRNGTNAVGGTNSSSVISVSGGTYIPAATALPTVAVNGVIGAAALTYHRGTIATVLTSGVTKELDTLNVIVAGTNSLITAYNTTAANNTNTSATAGNGAYVQASIDNLKAEAAYMKTNLINPILNSTVFSISQTDVQKKGYVVYNGHSVPYYEDKNTTDTHTITIGGVTYTADMVSIGYFKKGSLTAATSADDARELFVPSYATAIQTANTAGASIFTLGGTETPTGNGSFNSSNGSITLK